MLWPVALGIESIFLDIFGNIVFDIMLIIFLLIGLLGGIFLRPWFGNQVIKLIEREFRFVDLDIEEESAVSIECKDKKGMPPQKYFKYRPGYTGIVGKFLKKPVTRFFGREGTAYTWQMENGVKKIIDAYKGTGKGEIDLGNETGTLAAAVQTVWGSEFYSAVPAKQKKLLEDSNIGITVQLEQGPLTPQNFHPISEEDIKTEEDRKASETFWEGKKTLVKGQWIQWMFIFVAGFGVACALMIIGILRIPSGESTPPPSTNSTGTAAVAWLVWLIQKMI